VAEIKLGISPALSLTTSTLPKTFWELGVSTKLPTLILLLSQASGHHGSSRELCCTLYFEEFFENVPTRSDLLGFELDCIRANYCDFERKLSRTYDNHFSIYAPRGHRSF